MGYDFLSDEWFAEAQKIRDDAALPPASGPAADMKLNIVVTGGPSGDKEVHMAGGEFGEGLLDDAPTKLTVPYEVAKKTFIENDQQATAAVFR